MSDERKIEKGAGKDHTLEFIEKGARVVTHGNVNADKPPAGKGPVTKNNAPSR